MRASTIEGDPPWQFALQEGPGSRRLWPGEEALGGRMFLNTAVSKENDVIRQPRRLPEVFAAVYLPVLVAAAPKE